VDFLPPGDGIAGVCFLLTDLLAETFPFWGVASLLPADLLGVYFMILPTVFATSPLGSAAFLPAAFALEAAFFFPLAPPLTLGAADEAWSYSESFFKASFPFSWMKMSCSLTVAVVPSLNVKSEKSPPLSPFKATTPFSSTFTFFPSPILEMSGRESLDDFYNDFYSY